MKAIIRGIPALAGMTTLLFLGGAFLRAESMHGLLKQAESAWQQRDQPKKLEEAVALWTKALEQDPQRTEINIRLAKAMGRLFRRNKDAKARKTWAAQGVAYAEKALESDAKNPEALAAYAEALGQSAQANKGPGSLKKVKQAVNALNDAIAIKPDYAYAHMMVSNFYRRAPRMMSVGDLDKALEHGRKAVEYDANAVINHLAYAEALIAKDRKDEAKAQLEKALVAPGSPDTVPETQSDKEKVKRLLKELK